MSQKTGKILKPITDDSGLNFAITFSMCERTFQFTIMEFCENKNFAARASREHAQVADFFLLN